MECHSSPSQPQRIGASQISCQAVHIRIRTISDGKELDKNYLVGQGTTTLKGSLPEEHNPLPSDDDRNRKADGCCREAGTRLEKDIRL